MKSKRMSQNNKNFSLEIGDLIYIPSDSVMLSSSTLIIDPRLTQKIETLTTKKPIVAFVISLDYRGFVEVFYQNQKYLVSLKNAFATNLGEENVIEG